MRNFLLAGAAALTLTALSTSVAAQKSAEQVNGQARAAVPASAATPNPGSPAIVTPAQGSTTATPNPGSPAVVTHTNPGNLTPPPQSAMNKSYPVCTRRLQDNCQNPGEGGAPGKSRALGYWPGEPASERRERGG